MSSVFEPWAIALMAFGFVSTFFTVLFLTLLVQRREKQPLKYRGSWLLFLSSVGGYVGSAWLLLYLISEQAPDVIPKETFCRRWDYLVWVHYPLLVGPYALRCWRLVALFGANAAPSRSPGSGRVQWESLVMTESYLLKWLAFIVGLVAAARGILDLVRYQVHLPAYGMCLNVLEIAVSLWAIYRLRQIRDDYGSASELAYVTSIWVASTFALLAFLAATKGTLPIAWLDDHGLSSEVYLQAHAGITILRNMASFAISVVWPLYQTYTSPYVPLWSNCDSLRSLDSLLKDIVCIQHFRNYLAGQPGALQLVLCWVEVEIYKDLHDPDELRAQAQRIYERYVAPGAEMQVTDLGPDTVHAIQQDLAIGAAAEESFDQLQQELYDQLSIHFPKFLVSDSCEACVHALEREEELRDALEKSGML